MEKMNVFDHDDALHLLSQIGVHNAIMSDQGRYNWYEGDDAAHEIVDELFGMIMIQAEAEGWYEEAAEAVNAEVAKYAEEMGLGEDWVRKSSITVI